MAEKKIRLSKMQEFLSEFIGGILDLQERQFRSAERIRCLEKKVAELEARLHLKGQEDVKKGAGVTLRGDFVE